MPILGIRGGYKNGVAIPHERLDVPESEVVILFLEEGEKGAHRSVLTYTLHGYKWRLLTAKFAKKTQRYAEGKPLRTLRLLWGLCG